MPPRPMGWTPIRQAAQFMLGVPADGLNQVLERMLDLAQVTPISFVAVAGPRAGDAMSHLWRRGYQRVEAARRATCGAADERSDVLIVLGCQTVPDMRAVVAATFTMLRPGGAKFAFGGGAGPVEPGDFRQTIGKGGIERRDPARLSGLLDRRLVQGLLQPPDLGSRRLPLAVGLRGRVTLLFEGALGGGERRPRLPQMQSLRLDQRLHGRKPAQSRFEPQFEETLLGCDQPPGRGGLIVGHSAGRRHARRRAQPVLRVGERERGQVVASKSAPVELGERRHESIAQLSYS